MMQDTASAQCRQEIRPRRVSSRVRRASASSQRALPRVDQAGVQTLSESALRCLSQICRWPLQSDISVSGLFYQLEGGVEWMDDTLHQEGGVVMCVRMLQSTD